MSGKRLSQRSYSIANRVALVTGGASGIGRATCHVLSDHGVKIAVVDIGKERVDGVVKEINDCHGSGTAAGWVCDVKQLEEVQKTTDEVAAHFSQIDFLINCAGIAGGGGSIVSQTPNDYVSLVSNVVDVNLLGTLRFMSTCTPYLVKAAMKDKPDGTPAEDGTSRIINIASVAGLLTTGSYGYDASKHAVIGITKAACAELGPKGVTVNAICPGLVLTGMTAGAEDIFRVMSKSIPAKRPAEAEDIAQIIYLLLTPASAFVNGEYVVVDGGWTKILPAGWPYQAINGDTFAQAAAQAK